jgi:hypothetical protein
MTHLRLIPCVTLVAVWLGAGGGAYAQTPAVDALRADWRGGRYAEVMPRLLAFRDTPGGRFAEIDYMIATCACRQPEHQAVGRDWLARMLSVYELDPPARTLIGVERANCGTSQIAAANFPRGGARRGLAASVEGKTFYWVGQNNAVASSPARFLREVPYDELAERRFGLDEGPRAESYFRAQGLHARAAGAFVIVTSRPRPPDALDRVADHLGRVLDFYVSAYQLLRPQQLIAIYLLDDVGTLRRFAARFHGLEISSSTIGYSFVDDGSVAGVIPGQQIGTLVHELFHLLVRSNFGDIPAWLDEGLASLYEVSEISGGVVLGRDNWRRQVLSEHRHERPSLRRLVTMDANEFASAQENFNLVRIAANQATARYFLLFLQNEGGLLPLYRAFRDRPFNPPARDPAAEAAMIVERVTRRSLEELDAEFQGWFPGYRDPDSFTGAVRIRREMPENPGVLPTGPGQTGPLMPPRPSLPTGPGTSGPLAPPIAIEKGLPARP